MFAISWLWYGKWQVQPESQDEKWVRCLHTASNFLKRQCTVSQAHTWQNIHDKHFAYSTCCITLRNDDNGMVTICAQWLHTYEWWPIYSDKKLYVKRSRPAIINRLQNTGHMWKRHTCQLMRELSYIGAICWWTGMYHCFRQGRWNNSRVRNTLLYHN